MKKRRGNTSEHSSHSDKKTRTEHNIEKEFFSGCCVLFVGFNAYPQQKEILEAQFKSYGGRLYNMQSFAKSGHIGPLTHIIKRENQIVTPSTWALYLPSDLASVLTYDIAHAITCTYDWVSQSIIKQQRLPIKSFRPREEPRPGLAVRADAARSDVDALPQISLLSSQSPARLALSRFDGRQFHVNKVGSDGQGVALEEILSLTHDNGVYRVPDAALIRVLATSFCFDVRWFLQLLPRGIPTTIIKHARDPCQLSGSERSSSSASGPLPEHPLPDWADLCVIRPFLKGSANKPNNSGCMHPKLLLLWFVDRLRVVIGSANLHPAEWLSIGQVLWIQDFPPVSPAGSPRQQSRFLGYFHEQFRSTLSSFLCDLLQSVDDDRWPERARRSGAVQQDVIALLSAYDLRGAQACLVDSVPGYHYDPMAFEGTAQPPFVRPRVFADSDPTPAPVLAPGETVLGYVRSLVWTRERAAEVTQATRLKLSSLYASRSRCPARLSLYRPEEKSPLADLVVEVREGAGGFVGQLPPELGQCLAPLLVHNVVRVATAELRVHLTRRVKQLRKAADRMERQSKREMDREDRRLAAPVPWRLDAETEAARAREGEVQLEEAEAREKARAEPTEWELADLATAVCITLAPGTDPLCLFRGPTGLRAALWRGFRALLRLRVRLHGANQLAALLTCVPGMCDRDNPSPVQSYSSSLSSLRNPRATWLRRLGARLCGRERERKDSESSDLCIFHPTERDVTAGESGAVAMEQDSVENYLGSGMLRRCLSDPKGKLYERRGLFQHSKIMWREWTPANTARVFGWVYIGSHNLSASAWGSGTFLGNYELGALLLLRPAESMNSSSGSSFVEPSPPIMSSPVHVSPHIPVLRGVELTSLPLPFLSTRAAREAKVCIRYQPEDRPVHEASVLGTLGPGGQGAQLSLLGVEAWRLVRRIQDQLRYQHALEASLWEYARMGPGLAPRICWELGPGASGVEQHAGPPPPSPDLQGGSIGRTPDPVEEALLRHVYQISTRSHHRLCPDGIGEPTQMLLLDLESRESAQKQQSERDRPAVAEAAPALSSLQEASQQIEAELEEDFKTGLQALRAEHSSESDKLLTKIIRNLINHPFEKKHWRLKQSVLTRRLVPAAQRCLETLGFKPQLKEDGSFTHLMLAEGHVLDAQLARGLLISLGLQVDSNFELL